MENLKFENAEIKFRNFAGKERDFNPEGNRNFCIFMDVNRGRELEKDGWKIKYTKPNGENLDQKAYLPVAVSFDHVPPVIYMINSKRATRLGEEEVGMLDWQELKTVDCEIRPYVWNVSGRSGVKAYLKSMYAVIQEDPFAEKYYEQLQAEKKAAEESEDDLPF